MPSSTAAAGDADMTVSIEAFVRGQTVTATVSDAGQWSGDSSASQRGLERGRGLTMINGLADDVRTVRTAAGTRVTLTFERAVLLGARSGGRSHDMSRAEFQLHTLEVDGASTPVEVAVTGEVDASNVVEFTRSVRELPGCAADHPAAERHQVPGQCRFLGPGSTARARTRSSSCWPRTASCTGWRS